MNRVVIAGAVLSWTCLATAQEPVSFEKQIRPILARQCSGCHQPSSRQSDLLLYRFLYSAMRDLGDYFWWTELQRIFCRVFSTSEAKPAVISCAR